MGLRIVYISCLPSSILSSTWTGLQKQLALYVLTNFIVSQNGVCVYVQSGRTLLVTTRSFTLHKPLIHFMPLFSQVSISFFPSLSILPTAEIFSPLKKHTGIFFQLVMIIPLFAACQSLLQRHLEDGLLNSCHVATFLYTMIKGEVKFLQFVNETKS